MIRSALVSITFKPLLGAAVVIVVVVLFMLDVERKILNLTDVFSVKSL